MAGINRDPHEYRAVIASCPDFTIVGGQAINVWAITYLNPEDLKSEEGYGSHDLDVIAHRKAEEIVADLPAWQSEIPSMWSFDRRKLRLTAKDIDGRPLVIEVLKSVHGLAAQDLAAAVRVVEIDGVGYRLLDPIAMLKAKAANVRRINQDDRHDRAHLNLIARCVAPYLRDGHQHALAFPETQFEFTECVSRTFRTLFDNQTQRTLLAEGIDLLSMIPEDLGGSSIEKVRTSFNQQQPRLRNQIEKRISR
jgi:hypothetical protein